MSMVQKLTFLQKYASEEYAPMLPKAVLIWETAAFAMTRRAKLRVLEMRLQGGERFSGPYLVGLVRKICDPESPR